MGLASSGSRWAFTGFTSLPSRGGGGAHVAHTLGLRRPVPAGPSLASLHGDAWVTPSGSPAARPRSRLVRQVVNATTTTRGKRRRLGHVGFNVRLTRGPPSFTTCATSRERATNAASLRFTTCDDESSPSGSPAAPPLVHDLCDKS